jgi:8-oxo-dGTP pyrophosphatase MutT (NUDIX family)
VGVTLHDDAVRLLDRWTPPPGNAAAHESTLRLLRDGPSVMLRAHLAGHVTASAMIVHHDRQRVLLCLHGRFNMWCQVGGHCEAGDESLMAAALREATEESGIDGLVIDPEPIGLDIHPVHCSAGPSRHFDVRFAVLAPPEATEQVSEESKALGWFRPDSLPHPLADATEELVRPALARFQL